MPALHESLGLDGAQLEQVGIECYSLIGELRSERARLASTDDNCVIWIHVLELPVLESAMQPDQMPTDPVFGVEMLIGPSSELGNL